MQRNSETDDELLALAFPDFATDINIWRAINTRLDELCCDFLTLKRSALGYATQLSNCDTDFQAHLTEALDDLNNDIETLLRRMRDARSAATKRQKS